MKKVAHTVHEDRPGLLPREGELKAIRPEAEVEALLKVVAWNAAPAFREGFCITVFASWAYRCFRNQVLVATA